MPHQSTPTTYQSPKTTNWPVIILGILGVIIVIGIFFVIAVNKDVIKSDLSRKNISERGSSVLDPYLKNYDGVVVDCFDSEKGTFVPCEEIENDDEDGAVEGGTVSESASGSVRVSACGREFGGKTVCYDKLYKYETNANLQCASEGQTGMNPPGTCCPGLERVDGIRVAYGNVATPGTLCLTSCANGTYRQINGDCGPNPVANCLKENESATPDLWSDPRYCCPGLGHSVLVPDINMCVKIADTGVGYTANGSCSGSICSNYPNSSSSGVVDNTPPVVTGRFPVTTSLSYCSGGVLPTILSPPGPVPYGWDAVYRSSIDLMGAMKNSNDAILVLGKQNELLWQMYYAQDGYTPDEQESYINSAEIKPFFTWANLVYRAASYWETPRLSSGPNGRGLFQTSQSGPTLTEAMTLAGVTWLPTCPNSSASNSTNVTSSVAVPYIAFIVFPNSISSGQSTGLAWSVGPIGSMTCTASGGWSGAKDASGATTVYPTNSTTYFLTCTNSAGSATQSQSVIVN